MSCKANGLICPPLVRVDRTGTLSIMDNNPINEKRTLEEAYVPVFSQENAETIPVQTNPLSNQTPSKDQLTSIPVSVPIPILAPMSDSVSASISDPTGEPTVAPRRAPVDMPTIPGITRSGQGLDSLSSQNLAGFNIGASPVRLVDVASQLTPEGQVIPYPIFPTPVTSFTVPANPLLPPEYQEILNYEGLQYMNGLLRTQIGEYCEVETLVGNNIVSRTGILIGVGLNYILLQDVNTQNITACDFFNIKFVTFYY